MIENIQYEGYDDPIPEEEELKWYKLDSNWEPVEMDDFYSMYYICDENMSEDDYDQFERMDATLRTIIYQSGNFFWTKEEAEIFATKVRAKIAERNNPLVYDIKECKLLVHPWDDEPEDYDYSDYEKPEFGRYSIYGIWIADFEFMMRMSGDSRTQLYDSRLPIPIRIGKYYDFPLQISPDCVDDSFDGLFATHDEAFGVCKELRSMFHQNMIYVLNDANTEKWIGL